MELRWSCEKMSDTNNEVSMLRTRVRIRMVETVVYADVIACCKVAGYTFCIHPADNDKSKFAASYAPLGMRGCGGSYDTVADAVAALDRHANELPKIIDSERARMASNHMPLFAPETGLETFDWHWRENCRFESKEYLPVPKVCDRTFPAEHHIHLSVSKTETDFIAYTPSEAYGLADRQVRMKFGKYLKKTFADMSDAEIQTAVTAFRAKLALAEAPATLHFATDRATINDIFETRMYACDSSYTSCMHGKFDGNSIRPYHVYADSPDVAVAYVLDKGAIVSRSVVSTKDKVWIRPYSIHSNESTCCQVLRDLLTDAGYESGNLYGNRLTKLQTSRVMLPYIDNGGCRVSDAGKYWKVVEYNGDFTADQTDGTASDDRPLCDTCRNDEDDCDCHVCECCYERTRYGCEDCSMCEHCDCCTTHGGCTCDRCSDCSEIISPRSRHTTPSCGCDRCGECYELEANCDCEKCGECDELTENCTCEPEETETETETETLPESVNA